MKAKCGNKIIVFCIKCKSPTETFDRSFFGVGKICPKCKYVNHPTELTKWHFKYPAHVYS